LCLISLLRAQEEEQIKFTARIATLRQAHRHGQIGLNQFEQIGSKT